MRTDNEADHQAYMRRLDIEGSCIIGGAILGAVVWLHTLWLLFTRCP